MAPTPNPYRLRGPVVPVAYRIAIATDLDASTFSGRVEIDVEARDAIGEVTLHGVGLTLAEASARSGDTVRRWRDVTVDEDLGTMTIAFDGTIPAGRVTLELVYDAHISDGLEGFYRSTYRDGEGVERVIATTQFAHSFARRAFPCWDDPALKATFQVELDIPDGLAAYSNTAIIHDSGPVDGRRTVTFAPTITMSTYLVAWAIGPFEESRTVEAEGVPIRVVAPTGQAHLSEVALDAAAFAVRWFSDYFGAPYAGDKLDLVAIPDFAFGAMENLGCITFRESALIVDPAGSSQAERAWVVTAVQHEVAHQWFGNLVTMEWWEGVWLNEAFATFMQLICTDAYRPEWTVWPNMNRARAFAMAIDGLSSTRPVEYEVVSPDDAGGMFDAITYEKGASVLRMLEQYLGAETFRAGIRDYIARHQYANATTTDLWDALEGASGQPVRTMMETWIHQGGHPLVTYAGGTLTQGPFSYAPRTPDGRIGSGWLVPVETRRVGDRTTTRHLLGDRPVALADPPPVVVNAGGWGFFRVRYGDAELAALAPHVPELDALERATLLDDSWATLLAGQSTWDRYRLVVSNLGDRDEPAAWEAIADAFDLVRRPLDASQRARLVEQVRGVATPPFVRLGWERAPGEDELAARTRAALIGILGGVGEDEAVRAEAVRRFESGVLDEDLAAAILHVVAGLDRPGDYATFLERARDGAVPQEKERYLVGLGGFSDEAVALDAARRALDEFRPQDAPFVLRALIENPTTGVAVWRYVASRWDDVEARLPALLHTVVIGATTTFIAHPDVASEVDAFCRARPISPGSAGTVEQVLERLRIGVGFADALRRQL